MSICFVQFFKCYKGHSSEALIRGGRYTREDKCTGGFPCYLPHQLYFCRVTWDPKHLESLIATGKAESGLGEQRLSVS